MTNNQKQSTSIITLKCLKVSGRLRVRIITSGYKRDANCQFPRNIRKEGLTYTTPQTNIKLAKGPRGKYFYRVGRNNIKIVEGGDGGEKSYDNIKIYEDEDSTECIVCMDSDKQMVFVPCGHYCTCVVCCKSIKDQMGTCPLCRGNILDTVDISNVG